LILITAHLIVNILQIFHKEVNHSLQKQVSYQLFVDLCLLKTQLYKSISNYFHNYTNNKKEAFTFSL